MHPQLAEAHGIYELATGVRDELLGLLSDEDLAYRLPGNPSLGELLAQHASIQRSYIDSFATHRHDWSTIAIDPALAGSVGQLRERFRHLDTDLRERLDAHGGADDSAAKPIDRGGWRASPGAQLHTLREALIIALGKAVVYLRAMDRPIPDRVRQWVG